MSLSTVKKRLSHRARLTLVSAGTGGLLLCTLLLVAWYMLKDAELDAARALLSTSIRQTGQELRISPDKPDLLRVIRASPEVSLAVYREDGSRLDKVGSLDLHPVKSIELVDGMVVKSAKSGPFTIVAGLNWERYQGALRHLGFLGALLGLPLVGVVALATWLTAKATFQPLERLAQEAENLSLANLSARLSTDESGEYRGFVERLNRFLERLELAVRREERFLSDTAHELRTPLTVLRGQIETLLRRKRSPEEYREALPVLLEETIRLSSLVELLLRSARIPYLEAHALDLEEQAHRAHARWVDRFTAKGIGLELETQSVHADLTPSEFDVVIDNLLANSLRASPKGTSCWIGVHQLGQEATLEIGDEGEGISPQIAADLFERSVSGSTGGFGIGLSVVKRLVEARSGAIDFRAHEPSGAIFQVRFPISA